MANSLNADSASTQTVYRWFPNLNLSSKASDRNTLFRSSNEALINNYCYFSDHNLIG